jgi:hypothetical protein
MLLSRRPFASAEYDHTNPASRYNTNNSNTPPHSGPSVFNIFSSVVLGIAAVIGGGYMFTQWTRKDDSASPVTVTGPSSPEVELLHSKLKDCQIQLPAAIASEANVYIGRSELENQLRSFVSTKAQTGDMLVLYGPRGSGKSELVNRTLCNLPFVLRVDNVTAYNTEEDIIVKLAVQLFGFKKSVKKWENSLIPLIKEVSDKYGIAPTVVFDIAGIASNEYGINAVRNVCSKLSSSCRCVILLPEPHHVLPFVTSPGSERLVLVGDLSDNDAVQLLRNKNASLTEAEMKEVIATIGGQAGMLMKIAAYVRKKFTLKQFVDDVLRSARQDIGAFPHKEILQALKDNKVESIPVSHFGKNSPLSNPEAISAALKANNAIFYRVDTKSYQLSSRAHATALQLYPLLANVNVNATSSSSSSSSAKQ